MTPRENHNPVLGTSTAGSVHIDVERLVVSRMLLCANSGAGKSWALRRILEQTHGSIQQLVIDPEGEFFTLREKYDYVLAGKGGDCPAEPRSAALLARRLLELGTSAILDLYELTPADRVLFVRRFVEALVDAPKDLWHPVLVVVDEAHSFAPENGHGQAQSSEAIARLMAQGRKRGFAGLLATQRVAKLSKDVAAEANNVLVGRMALDIDQKRGAAALGIPAKEAADTLRSLKPGHFFAFGPALSDEIVEVHVGDVKTSHPKAGQRASPPPPPRERVKKILGQLADLPKEAAEETKTIEEARGRIKVLERELAAAKKAQPEAKVEIVEVPMLTTAERKSLDDAVKQSELVLKSLLFTQEQASTWTHDLRVTATALAGKIQAAARGDRGSLSLGSSSPSAAPRRPVAARVARPKPESAGDGSLTGPERKLLTALAQHGRMSKVKLALLTNYSHKGGGFLNPLGQLRTRGLVDYLGGDVNITDQGLSDLGTWEELPTGEQLRERWLGQLDGPMSKILRAVCEVWPNSVGVDDLAEATGYSAKGGGFLNPLGRLRTLELIGRGKEVRASDALFDTAGAR